MTSLALTSYLSPLGKLVGQRWGGFAACVLLCMTVGCSDRLKTYPVSGQVVFKNGTTAHMGTVECKSREHGVLARGTIDQKGRFQLTTYRDGDGAVAGLHDCVIVQMVLAEGVTHTRSTYGVINPKHGSYKSSGLQFEVKTSEPNDIKLMVEGIEASYGTTDKHEHDKRDKAVPDTSSKE